MGGDHQCPVCKATFTRPQHVARHMRSHTGDRPYKCQYCGDQFARSDLLSRHVNKCHAHEKPPSTAGNSRRKGASSASRATTSKQSCDQCVQASLPCDGSNPCAKCVQRNCRCTFVKFHRQTAPVGPGHDARPSASSSRLSTFPSADDFQLGPAPLTMTASMSDSIYAQHLGFPRALQEPALSDSQDEYTGHASLSMAAPEMYSEIGPSQSWLGWTPQSVEAMTANQTNIDFALPYQYTDQGTALSSYPGDTLQNKRISLAHGHIRRGSFDFSSDSSRPSSAASSSVHLPVEMTSQLPYNDDHSRQSQMSYPNSVQPHDQINRPHQEGFSSAFGLMSLEDANVLAGLNAVPFFSDANMYTHDPNSTPMPAKPHSGHHRNHTYDGSTPLSFQTPGSTREAETRELREFMRTYMRTPLSGSDPSSLDNAQRRPTSPARRVRVASLPSAKTPTTEDVQPHYSHGDDGNLMSSVRTTLYGNEDLSSYRAAVLALKVPTNLNLVPRRGKGSHVPCNIPPPSNVDRPRSENSREFSGSDLLRPSFKRLPSQTLGPANAKRTQLSHSYDDGSGDRDVVNSPMKSGGDGEPGNISKTLSNRQPSGRPIVHLTERRLRRMSAPTAVDLESLVQG